MKIVLVGAGGYGNLHLNYLLHPEESDAELVGIVEPYFDTLPGRDAVLAAGIPVYETLADFFRAQSADLAVIAAPTHLHAANSILALRHGAAVLCEKPLAPTVAEGEAMCAAEAESGRFLAIGYQWSYSAAIQELKRDILAGRLGRPLSMRTMIRWPRDDAYYGRGSGWGGRIEKDGVMILDSIASNACAHYLHNMLFLLGEHMEESAQVTALSGECLRANRIETFDTCALRLTAAGVPLYFLASHATDRTANPVFHYRFEKAEVFYDADAGSHILARFSDGSTRDYGNPFADDCKKLKDCIAAVRQGTRPVCTASTALPHTRLIGQIHEFGCVTAFPTEVTAREPGHVYVPGLFECMDEAYARTALFSEMGYPFAKTFSNF